MRKTQSHRASTLDIIHKTTTPARLALTAQTGDLLLCGVSRDTRTGAGRLLIAFGGSSSTERRLPIVHVAVVIRNPPPAVRAAYGLPPLHPQRQDDYDDYDYNDDDTQVYALDASPKHGDGCRLKTMEEWAEEKVNGTLQCRIFYRAMDRTRATTTTTTTTGGTNADGEGGMPREFWDWLLMARKIPYFNILSKHGSSLAYNTYFIPGAYSSTVAVATEISMELIKDYLVGNGPMGHVLAGIGGILANIVWAVFLGTLVLFTFFLTLPYHVSKKRIDRVHIGDDDNNIKGLTCSATVAKTLMRAGWLNATADATWYLPRDFLPQGVGAHTNLMDDHLVPGVKYSHLMTEILLQDKANHHRHHRASLRYSFLAMVDAELMKFDD